MTRRSIRYVDLASSGSEYETAQEELPIRKTRSSSSVVARHSTSKPIFIEISDDDSVNDGSEEDFDEPMDVDGWGMETVLGAEKARDVQLRKFSKPNGINRPNVFANVARSRKRVSRISPFGSRDRDDDVVPGKPAGRLWMKEVRITHTQLAIASRRPPASRPRLEDNHSHQRRSFDILDRSRFAMPRTFKRQKVVNGDETSGSDSQSPSTAQTTPPVERYGTQSKARPARKAALKARTKASAHAHALGSDEGNASEFEPGDKDTSPEPVLDDEGNDDQTETSDEVQESSCDDTNLDATPASRIVHSNGINKVAVHKDQYGYGLDESLPPMTDISVIFGDMAGKALYGKNLKAIKIGKTKVTLKHGLADAIYHLNSNKIRVATMCSGTESPIIALDLISDALKHRGFKLEYNHLFSAEIVPYKQAYIERNFAPPIIFRDITEMTADRVREATTAYGSKVAIPGDVDLLVTGFSCVDHSNLNNNPQGKKSSKGGESGPSESGDTMKALLAYIKKFRPKMVIIENVKGAPWKYLGKQLDDLQYDSKHMALDTKLYYIPHTRQRGYMFCLDRNLFTQSNGADSAVETWGSLMKILERPASSPAHDFLLGENDPRLILARLDLDIVRGEAGPRKTVDWARCQGRHKEVRDKMGLGDARPLTHWMEGGSSKAPDYFWAKYVNAQVERVKDTMDINFLRSMAKGFDIRYKSRIIDLSQNVDRNTDATKAGVTSCLTPSGIPFSTARGGPIIGFESLILQGLPANTLQLNLESQAQLQDLAGNAMTSTVVGAAIISALIVGHQVLPRGFEGKYNDTTDPTDVTNCLEHDTEQFPVDFYGYTPLSVDEACNAAGKSVRLCTCEDTSGHALGPIQRCIDCEHTACIFCGKNPEHNYKPYSVGNRLSPADFEAKISEAIPMKMRLNGIVTPSSLREIEVVLRSAFVSETEEKKDELQNNVFEAIKLACKSEVRYCSQPDRSEVWVFAYESEHARARLLLCQTQAEWQFYAKVPPGEPVNSPIRKLLANPFARILAKGSDLTEGDCQFWNPEAYSFEVTIEGEPTSLKPSFENCLGLRYYQDTKVYREYNLSIAVGIDDKLGVDIGGRYRLLKHCGTASGSLYVQETKSKKYASQATAKLLYLFLDPDLLGNPKNDSFVLSHDKRRILKGHRSCVAVVENTWRPDRLKEGIDDDGLKKIYRHQVQEERAKDKVTYCEVLSDYEVAPKTVKFQTNGSWIDLPHGKLNQGHEEGLFRRAKSSFHITPASRSCQMAHVVLVCKAQVPEGELQSFIDWEVVSRVNEAEFFSTFAWLIIKACHFPNLSKWSTMPHSPTYPHHCIVCSRQAPRILWKLNDDGKFIPFEDYQQAAALENSLRFRPKPVMSQIKIDKTGSIELTVSINPETLMHRAARNLSDSTCQGVEMSWQLLTNHRESVKPSFRPLRVTDNETNVEAGQPPSFSNFKLSDNQLRSLDWMINQENSPVPFIEEEIEERMVSQLGWLLRGQATKPVVIRGGVLADQVGFGKTATTLGLIDTQRDQDALMAQSRKSVKGQISIKASLIIVPAHLTLQWKNEIHKFMSRGHQYDVLLIKNIADLKKYTIGDFQKADIIIVSWSLCEADNYLFKIAQFAGRNELPSKCSDRVARAWYKDARSVVATHVDELKGGGATLHSTVNRKLKINQDAAYDAQQAAVVPSKRLRGKDYRKKKLEEAASKSTERKRKRDSGDVDDELNTELDGEPDIAAAKREEPQHRLDDFKLKQIANGNLRWTGMPYPLLEMFEFSRIVVDEFTYAKGNESMVIPTLLSRSRWILSGTPPLEDFADVKSISKFLGINLGIDDMTPGVTKRATARRLAKDMTSFEKFKSFQMSHSSTWHENRHELAQRFLDQFVRQNLMDLNNLPGSRHWMPITLPAAERAIYLELQSNLAASEGEMFTDSSKNLNDRDQRIRETFDNATNGGEALIKSAASFSIRDPDFTIYNPSKSDEIIAETRRSHYVEICHKLVEEITKAEALHKAIGGTCAQYINWKASINSMHFGDKDAGQRMIELLSEGIQKGKSAKAHHKDTTNTLRTLTNELTKKSIELVKCVRSLRFLESILDLKDLDIDISCSVCQTKFGLDNLLILVECGHIVCRTCLTIAPTEKEGRGDKCPVSLCKANKRDFQSIPAIEFKLLDDDSKVTAYHGKKLEEVVKLIKMIPKTDQVLLFVQYASLIEHVGHAFDAQGITHTALSGVDDPAKVLVDWQKDTSKKTKVMILNIGDASAAGSNLVNANHVVFLAPYRADDAQAYKQAMIQAEARARRYGQEKHVHVYHFLSLKTIDVDIIETRTQLTLVEGVNQDKGFKIPFSGFESKCFGLKKNCRARGQFRSESSVCVGED